MIAIFCALLTPHSCNPGARLYSLSCHQNRFLSMTGSDELGTEDGLTLATARS